MRVRHNLTLGGMIMLIVLACMIAAGYFWYSHAKAVRLREERAAKVTAAEQKIVVYEDDNKKLLEDKKTVKAEAEALEPKVKAAKEASDASTAKAKELNGYLADFRRKMDDARRAADQNNREITRSTNGDRGGSSDAAKIKSAERNLIAFQKELEKANCHFECMGRSKPTQKERSSDDGVWVFDKLTNKPLYWRCKKHGYTFTKPIEYLDHKNEASKLTAEIGKQQRLISELRNQTTSGNTQQSADVSRFDSSAWNAKYAEYQEVVRKAQEAANDDRKALDALNEEKRKLDIKLSNIDREIETNETAIKNERLLIAENQK